MLHALSDAPPSPRVGPLLALTTSPPASTCCRRQAEISHLGETLRAHEAELKRLSAKLEEIKVREGEARAREYMG